MNRTLYIIRGIPGSGKSSLGNSLCGDRSLAADDYPLLYQDGKYHPEHQSDAHDWLFRSICELIEDGSGLSVAVTAIFNPIFYMKRYIGLAQRSGWFAHIVHCESVLPSEFLVPNQFRYTLPSVHDVSDSVIQYYVDSWEPFNKSLDQFPSASDLASEFLGLRFKIPDLVICDMDQTLKSPASDQTFPKSPDDFKVNVELVELLKKFSSCNDNLRIYIASNQRGIKIKKKSRDFLLAEVINLDRDLFRLGLDINAYLFAPSRNSNTFWSFFPERPDYDQSFKSQQFSIRADKPGHGMFSCALMNYLVWSGEPEKNDFNIWIIGDAHNPKFFSDWQAFLAFKQWLLSESFWKDSYSVSYLPVEFVPLLFHPSLQ